MAYSRLTAQGATASSGFRSSSIQVSAPTSCNILRTFLNVLKTCHLFHSRNIEPRRIVQVQKLNFRDSMQEVMRRLVLPRNAMVLLFLGIHPEAREFLSGSGFADCVVWRRAGGDEAAGAAPECHGAGASQTRRPPVFPLHRRCPYLAGESWIESVCIGTNKQESHTHSRVSIAIPCPPVRIPIVTDMLLTLLETSLLPLPQTRRFPLLPLCCRRRSHLGGTRSSARLFYIHHFVHFRPAPPATVSPPIFWRRLSVFHKYAPRLGHQGSSPVHRGEASLRDVSPSFSHLH